MTTGLAIIDDEHETKDQKRKRLAGELRFITDQFNSKVIELLDTGVKLVVHTSNHKLTGRNALIGTCDISYQTSPKFY